MERLTPLDIFNKDFKHALRGYDVDEVNEFLDVIIKNFEYLIEENRELKEQLKSVQQSAPEETDSDIVIQDLLRRVDRLEKHVWR